MLAQTHIPAQWAQEEGFVDGFVTPGAAAEATRVGPEAGGVSGGVGAGGEWVERSNSFLIWAPNFAD